MTVEEFYQFCKEHGITDYKILMDEISINGCFIGFKKVFENNIAFGYDNIYGEDMVWFVE